ncbi:uncharacterized protein LOC101858424 [Aplysia californica]|uniref:Uncharacterized protein LOC101858424 n=1 Tax=Aplysia californica TaxID=6500 RepID=A0ABM0JW22_APLCA|nr:uncharacterized protein LOC101858424 [Aplysia californica]
MASVRHKVKVTTQTMQKVMQHTTETHFHVCAHREHPPTAQPRPSSPINGGNRWAPSEVDLSTLPYRYPETEENHEAINDLLEYSLEQQREFEISDNAGFVVTVLHRCLNALNVQNSVVHGYRDLNGVDIPHMWLEIKQYYIDNSFLRDICKSSVEYLRRTYPRCYKISLFKTSDPPPIPTGETIYETKETRNYLRKNRIAFYAELPDYGLAQSFNREQSYNFYFAMVRYMFDKHQVSFQGIDPQIRYICWRCKKFPKAGLPHLSHIITPESGQEYESDSDIPQVSSNGGSSWRFLQCPRCMVASYCSRRCQEADWAGKHVINCLSRGSVYLPRLGDIDFPIFAD